MIRLIVYGFIAVSTVHFLTPSLAAGDQQPAPATVTATSIVQKFQDRFESDRGYLRKPLDELTAKYRQALTQQKEEYEKAGNAAGIKAAESALQAIDADASSSKSEDPAVETLRTNFLTERGAKLHDIAPKVKALFADYAERHKALIQSLVEKDFTDDALAASDRAQKLRDWMSAQPEGQPYSEEVVLSLLTKGLPRPSDVIAWGWDEKHQSTVPANLTGVIAVAGGIFHSLALKSDGTVVAWGSNDDGQTQVPAGLNGVVAIAAGEKHSLALKSDGTVVAWGYNKEKQCEVPKGLANVKAISSHCWHSIALKTDGTVVAWGRNTHGELNIPAGLTDVVQVSAGAGHNLALKSDGTVVAWGMNDHGQATVPGDLNHVTAIAAGHFHNLALKSDGTVVGWGYNNYGQTTIPRGLTHVTAIAAHGWHSAALTAEGQVRVWGFKNHGQTSVPATLTNVSLLSCGTYHVLAVRR